MTFRFGFRAGDKLVVHHVGSYFGARTGNGGVAVKNKDVVRVKLQEQFEGRFIAVVGIGVLSNVLEAEFIADQGAAGLVAQEVEVGAGDESHHGSFPGRSGADAVDAAGEMINVGLSGGFFPENLGQVH